MLFPLYNYYSESSLSLNEIIEDFIKSQYLKKHGSDKVEKIIKVIVNSSRIAAIDAFSIQQRVVPNYMDFGAAINSVPWFMFQSNETQALGVLITAREWASRVNRVYHFGSDREIRDKALKILEKFSIYREMSREQYDSMRTGYQEPVESINAQQNKMSIKYSILVQEMLAMHPSFRILRENPGFIAIGGANFMAAIEFTIQEIDGMTIIHLDTEDRVHHRQEHKKWEYPSSMDQHEMLDSISANV